MSIVDNWGFVYYNISIKQEAIKWLQRLDFALRSGNGGF